MLSKKMFLGIILSFVTSAAYADNVCLRTSAVRVAIEQKVNKPCNQITALDLASVTGNLMLSSNDITDLKAVDFQGLSSLISLSLDGNQLPAGVFQGLTSLQMLYLTGNKISSFPVGIFQGLPSLLLLSIDNNSISSLPEVIFQGTTLISVSLDNNQIESLPEAVFQGLNERFFF